MDTRGTNKEKRIKRAATASAERVVRAMRAVLLFILA
jgi:hypothetical protein